jgi:hypothetical protein
LAAVKVGWTLRYPFLIIDAWAGLKSFKKDRQSSKKKGRETRPLDHPSNPRVTFYGDRPSTPPTSPPLIRRLG